MIPIVFSWSGGKDSTLALHDILTSKLYDVKYLLSTINEHHNRVSMHGLRLELLKQQANSIGIPLEIVFVPDNTNNQIYEDRMSEKLLSFKNEDINTIAFGDIHLEDVKKYRKNNLEKIGMNAIFPIWERDTKQLFESFVNLGYQAITICIDNSCLDEKFAGRHLNKQFLSDLPNTIDVCGENGEFHSFVYDGPIFKNRINIKTGDKIVKEYDGTHENSFTFCDLLPASQ